LFILFGAIVTPLHSRVTFHKHDIALSHAQLAADGAVTFDAYIDAGPHTGAAYIIAAKLVDAAGATVAQWDGAALAALAPDAIRNGYPYVWASKFKTERIGFSGQTARAPPSRCRHLLARSSHRGRATSSYSKPSTAASGRRTSLHID